MVAEEKFCSSWQQLHNKKSRCAAACYKLSLCRRCIMSDAVIPSFLRTGCFSSATRQNGSGDSFLLKTRKASLMAILRKIPVVTGHVLSAPFSSPRCLRISFCVMVIPFGMSNMYFEISYGEKMSIF